MSISKKPKNNSLSSILVAATGYQPDTDAVSLACSLLGHSKSHLYISYVIEVERSMYLDSEITHATAKGEEVLKNMETVAKQHKYEVSAELLQARQSGPAVVAEAVDKEVDAIILAVPYGKAYGSFSIGKIAKYVLKNAPCKVILWRDQMLGKEQS